MKKNKILVTGGAGFIGSHIVRDLIDLGHDVVVIDDMSGGFLENIPLDNCRFYKMDITDKQLISKLFGINQFDYVFHLAAYAAEGLSHFIRNFNYTNNVIGSINLINESIKHNIKCFIFTSSIAVYGANQLPMTEEMIPAPEDPYGIAKYAVEMDLKAAHKMFGLDYIIFRPHNVYGPYQNIGDKYRNVIGIFMNQIMQNKPLTIFGDGTQNRAFSYIKDISPIIAKSAFCDWAYNEVFNIGADFSYSINALIETLLRVWGLKVHPIKKLRARNEVHTAYSNHNKVKEYFYNWNNYNLETGLKEMTEWVKKVGIKKSKDFQNIEIKKNMPEGW